MPATLWAGGLSMTTVPPGFISGIRHSSSHWRKIDRAEAVGQGCRHDPTQQRRKMSSSGHGVVWQVASCLLTPTSAPPFQRSFGSQEPWACSAKRACHRCVCAGFIDEHVARKVESGLANLPEITRQGHIRPILLRRIDRFFRSEGPTVSSCAAHRHN